MQSVASSLFPMKRRGAGLVLGLLAAFLLVALPAHAQLNGNYTVGGASPNYASIDLAVAALNSGVSGPVTFLIRTGTYVPPTNGWRLFAAAGMSATNKVTFKPDVGASVVITGNTGTTTQTGPFTLDGGRYYVIDGSNTNGGTTKNMTIISTEINYNPAIMIKNDADFNVVKNCNLQSAATSGTSYYGYGVVFFGPTTTTSGNDSNVIQNCTIGDPTGVNRCYCGVGFYGQSTGTYMNVGNKIIGCDIINFRFYGIWHYDYSIGTLIQKNQIHMTVPGQSTAMYAIYIQNTSGVSANPIIDSNKIYKILGAPTTGSQTIVGIYTSLSSIPSGTVQITNNMISFFEDGYIYYYPMQLNNNYSSTSSTLTYNIYYNSIYTGGTATSFAQTFAIYYYAYNSSGIGAASLCNQRDNIYYSTRAGGTSTSYGMYIYQSPFIAGAFTSNNNLIQLNTDFNYYTAYFNFSLYTTLPSYQTSGQDLQSYGTNPQFVDPNNCDLHIQAGKRTVVEGRAAVLAGQTTDYDGQARSGSTPDIGCDEGTFLATIPLDATADRFLPPLVPNATLKSNTTFTPIGFFSNLSSTTQTIPVRTRILNASSTVVYNDLWNYSVPAYNSQRVVFNAVGNAGGTTALPAGVYTLEMGTELGTDGDATNNKISFTINIKDPLNGIYTINKLGAGVRNYTSFTGAIGDLNVVGVSAAVTFKVATGIYDSTTETFPLVLKPAAGASSTNTVTFKNDSLAVVTITNMSASTPVVDIVDADYVTIDGGNLATGNPRAMKIINTGAATPAVRLYSGAQFNVLKNLNLISGNINSTSGIGGAVNIGNAPTFFSNSDNQILSCTIGDSTGAIRPAVGIYMLGETSYRNSRNRIEDCDIINFGNNGNSLANGIYWSTYNDNMKVFRNRFTMTNVSNTASVSSVYVIYITNSQNLNDSISYNKIWNVKTLAPSVTMIGTFLSSPAIVSPFVVSNNMITLTNDTGQTYCIYNATAANPQWYIDHNTLTLRGNNPSTSTGVGTCFRITSTANVQLRNNLMFNERFWAYGIANYCIYRTSSGTLTSNGNYFYNANSTTDYVAYNTSTATNYQTLASWQVTGADLNSISGARPPVVDPTTGDMHIQTQPVYAG